MRKINKGTFVFDKNDFCCAGFFIEVKKTVQRGALGFGPTPSSHVLIEDLWNGRTTGLMSMANTNELSTDKKLFTKLVTEQVNHYKNIIQNQILFVTPSQKRKMTNHEKKKVAACDQKDNLKLLAKDLEFYEILVKEVQNQSRVA